MEPEAYVATFVPGGNDESGQQIAKVFRPITALGVLLFLDISALQADPRNRPGPWPRGIYIWKADETSLTAADVVQAVNRIAESPDAPEGYRADRDEALAKAVVDVLYNDQHVPRRHPANADRDRPARTRPLHTADWQRAGRWWAETTNRAPLRETVSNLIRDGLATNAAVANVSEGFRVFAHAASHESRSRGDLAGTRPAAARLRRAPAPDFGRSRGAQP